MKDVNLLLSIVRRADAESFIDFYSGQGVPIVYSTPGMGTARSAQLGLLGLERSEKTVLLSVLPGEQLRRVLHALTYEMKIALPDRGVAVAVPLTAMGGAAALRELIGEQELTEREENGMEHAYEMIVAIAEKGHAETVMDAARSARAGGGTVIHAKGTGAMAGERFLGISLGEEKEVIYIVTERDRRADIMRAIMRDAGGESPAHALVFSLPVTAAAGLRLREITED